MIDLSSSTSNARTWAIVPSKIFEANDRWNRISRRLIAQIAAQTDMTHQMEPTSISLVESFDAGTGQAIKLPPTGSLVLWSAGPADIVITAERLLAFYRSNRNFLHILAAPKISLASVVELQRLGIHFWTRHPEDLAAMLPLIQRYFQQDRPDESGFKTR